MVLRNVFFKFFASSVLDPVACSLYKLSFGSRVVFSLLREK